MDNLWIIYGLSMDNLWIMIWLVVEVSTPLKKMNEFVNWDDDIPFPTVSGKS